MNRSAWKLVAILLALSLKTARATDPYPIDSLSEITSRWTEAASSVTRMHADVRKFQYDSVYRTVSEWKGTVDFERPNRCRLELRPVAAELRKSVTRENVKFEPVDGDAFTWIWTDDEWICFCPKLDICEAVPLKTTSSQPFWWNPLSSHLMLQFVTSDPKAIGERGYKLVQQQFRTQEGLTAFPVSEDARREVHRIDILFDPNTGLPRAIRAINPQETMTTVLVVSKVQLNPMSERSNLFKPPAEVTRFTPVAANLPAEKAEEVAAGERPIYEATPFWDLLVSLLGAAPDRAAPTRDPP